MHVLIVPSWYKSQENPVMGSFFEEQARALAAQGITTGILFPGYINFSSKEKPSRKVWDDAGLPTWEISAKAILPQLRNLNYSRFARQVRRFFLEYVAQHGRPDLIHAHSVFWGGIAAEKISRQTGIPFLLTEHLTRFHSGDIEHPDDLAWAKKVYQASATNIVVSNAFKLQLTTQLALAPNRFKVVNNMVNPLFFENFTPKNILDEEELIFFTNSFLVPRKNHRLIIEAFQGFLSSGRKARLRIGGDGEEGKALGKFVSEKGLTQQVDFLGMLSREQVAEEMRNCHVFLLGSTYETFGVVLIEALAAGRPVISTNCGGPRDIVTPENGILVSPHSPEAFSRAMVEMVELYPGFDQKSIAKDCKERFSGAAIMKKVIRIYRQVLNS